MLKRSLVAIATVIAGLSFVAKSQAQERYCREYSQGVMVGGRMEDGYGTACMQPDGSWEIVKPAEAASRDSYAEYARYDEPYVIHETVVREEPVYVQEPPFQLVIGYNDWDHRRHWRKHRDKHYHKHHHKHHRHHDHW